MALSSALISEFVKVTNNSDKSSKSSTAWGTVVTKGENTFVQLDGSDILTPVSATTEMQDGDRVRVTIKDHVATATGNLTSPAPRTETMVNGDKAVKQDIINEFDNLVAYSATIKNLDSKYATIENLKTTNANVEKLNAEKVNAEDLRANYADIKLANIDFANVDVAKIGELFAESGVIDNVITENGSVTGVLAGVTIKGDLIEGGTIVADKLVIKGDDGLYYKLNTLGIGENSYEDHVTYVETSEEVSPANGVKLDGVTTTTGDDVYSYDDAGVTKYYTIIDDVYYAVDAEVSQVKVEQTDYNSLNGSLITAKSITASKVNVTDLVAFGATIGGFRITKDAIHSTVKDSVESSTPGIYLDNDGQFNVGDADNYIRYVRNTHYVRTDTVIDAQEGILIYDTYTSDGHQLYSFTDTDDTITLYTLIDNVYYKVDEAYTYSLSISADTVMYSLNGTKRSLSDLGAIGEYVKIGAYTDGNGNTEPCIELGEKDTDFKLIITNTQMLFMDGTETPAYFTNKALCINKAIVKDELYFGQFVWKERANGNMGVIWVDEEVDS